MFVGHVLPAFEFELIRQVYPNDTCCVGGRNGQPD